MTRLMAAAGMAAFATLGSAQYIHNSGNRLQVTNEGRTLTIEAVAPDVVRVTFRQKGSTERPTEMMDPRGLRRARPTGKVHDHEIDTALMHVSLSSAGIQIGPKDSSPVVTIAAGPLGRGVVQLKHEADDNLYGMRGNGLFAPAAHTELKEGILRNSGAFVAAGSQGDGGAPLAYSSHWGVLVDSIDGDFKNSDGVLEFSNGSRKDVEAYVVLGQPKRTMEVVADLTGHPPMPPKWALGFMNSQWGTDEKMVRGIVDEYRSKKIPLDAFIFDFDFKAWGEDNFGEWRWNSTNGPGNVGPMKYPNGQNGKFGKWMASKGVHMVGIMKPRALTQNVDLKPTMTAKVADAHRWWIPGKKPYTDYFSHRLANDFDFSNPDLRRWYWERSKNLFDTGISGWWNDEADDNFPSLGFFQMQRSLFEGQTSVSDRRVWSINRNFYLGAQRFAFGTWSGDIGTGFQVMADQRTRMLDLISLGQSHWSMDTGGFNGHPDPENYARWVEFAATVPIMRVHSTYGQRRQPWVYGPTAEAAATNAIYWRYSMFPSLYSWEREANQTGIGIVRPLSWEFPDDPRCADVTDSWLMGDGLLVAPVVEQGQSSKRVYLPDGTWYRYGDDKVYPGRRSVVWRAQPMLWTDIPMYVRGGTILATQPVLQYENERPVDEITLDVWPDASRPASFDVYDDDGETRGYEHGAYFAQRVTATADAEGVTVRFAEPKGSYETPLKTYRVRFHGESVETPVVTVKAGRALTVRAPYTFR